MLNDCLKYWGKAKYSKETDDYDYHLLPFHCMDVVAVADIWLKQSKILLKQISRQINKTPEESKAIVLFFIALHDFGKFDARFQSFVPEIRIKLQGDEFEVEPDPIHYSHGPYGYYYFSNEFIDSDAMKQVAGHHGYYDTTIQFMKPEADEELIELDERARKEWVEFCLNWFELSEIPNTNEISMIAGLCSISDWLGSSMTSFTKDPKISINDYYTDALSRAKIVLNESGMIAQIKKVGFETLFKQYKPKGIQKLLNKVPLTQGLTLVESDTGSGKTEFALSYASMLIKAGFGDGIVFGLPSQATANGLFKRIGDISKKLFPDNSVIRAHGKSKYLNSDENGFLFQSSKRAFLGSMSVATIDQILMGVLNIKHQFVRSFGTRKSVLILDEIHSFDNYMYGLIEQVLKGQHQAFSSVILLSATLPKALKQQLLKTYQGQVLSDQYPLVSHIDIKGKQVELTLPKSNSSSIKSINTQIWESDNQIPDKEHRKKLINWVKSGVMVGVICNTVHDAQLLYSLLKAETNVDIDIFHARYTFSDRMKIENKILNKYGKTAKRDGGLLIATQVIEQSLDLDFDVMVSQIAPIEFLMQRMGRLWRHNRAPGSDLIPRNTVISKPLFISLCPTLKYVESNFLKGYKGSGFVYKNIRVLFRTQHYLQENKVLNFPSCYREAIYKIHDNESFENEPKELETIYNKYKNEQESSFYSAKWISNHESKPLTDVNPRSALLTREGELSQSVVLFNQNGELLHGGNFDEQYDREQSTVSLSKKLAKGDRDESHFCLRAVVNEDLNYSEIGIYDQRLVDELAKIQS